MLVDRGDQLVQLSGLVSAAAVRGPCLATIAGSAASGKTTLVSTFAERAAAAGAVVYRASAVQPERTLPLATLRRLFAAERPPGAWSAHLPVEAGIQGLEADAAARRTVRVPRILVIDDAHYADAASLHSLFGLVSLLGTEPFVLLLVGQGADRSATPDVVIPPPPGLVRLRLRLDPLSADAVREVLARDFGRPLADRLAADGHLLSGGNPRLLRGLLDDLGQDPEPASVDAMAGAGYREAVRSLLTCCGHGTARVALGLVLLEERATPHLLARLLRVDPDAVVGGIRWLNHAGVLKNGRFRHREAREAVLATATDAQQADLHARAAALLYEDRAPVAAVARHLLSAKRAAAGWEIAVLCKQAEQALCAADADLAFDCLRLAEGSATDERQRSNIAALLARMEWTIDPAAGHRRIPELVGLVGAGRLGDSSTLDSIGLLLSSGHDRVAAEALARFEHRKRTLPPEVLEQLRFARSALEFCYPGTKIPPATGVGRDPDTVGRDPDASAGPAEPPEPAASATETMPLFNRLRSGAPSDEVVAATERLLSVCTLTSRRAKLSAFSGLFTLIAAERLSAAKFWCDVFISEASDVRMTSWQAIFSAVMADIALRQGDLRQSRASANAALAAAAMTSGELWVGASLAALIQTDTVMGRIDRVEERLRVGVPDGLFRSLCGPAYLRARGQYLHAIGRHRAALDDFETAGRTLDEWRMDLPALVPWRTDAAQVQLALGRPDAARELAREQLEHCGPDSITPRAAALRLLAACTEPAGRPALLREAVGLLQAGGDRLELVRTVADFSRCHGELGNVKQARFMRRRAQLLARQAGAEGLVDTLLAPPREDPAKSPPAKGGGYGELSCAERRVATLAALGYTNRHIAEQLSITASTVEQHLTRVYRKLNVKSRAHLLSMPDLTR